MSKQNRPDLYAVARPDKRLEEMTVQERAGYARKLRQALRDDSIRLGRKRPLTAREQKIFEEGQAERDAREQKRVDRLKRKGRPELHEP